MASARVEVKGALPPRPRPRGRMGEAAEAAEAYAYLNELDRDRRLADASTTDHDQLVRLRVASSLVWPGHDTRTLDTLTRKYKKRQNGKRKHDSHHREDSTLFEGKAGSHRLLPRTCRWSPRRAGCADRDAPRGR